MFIGSFNHIIVFWEVQKFSLIISRLSAIFPAKYLILRLKKCAVVFPNTLYQADNEGFRLCNAEFFIMPKEATENLTLGSRNDI